MCGYFSNTAKNLTLTSGGAINDVDGKSTTITTTADATFKAATTITLADEDAAANKLDVAGKATFTSTGPGDIDVGVKADGSASASDADFGSVGAGSARALPPVGGPTAADALAGVRRVEPQAVVEVVKSRL